MEGEARVLPIDRKSSIETEPRTLTFDQIQYAREAALCVINTRSVEEAVRIFTEGLKPVVSMVRRRNGEMKMGVGIELDYLEDDDHDLRLQEIRDVATAPF